MEKSVFEFEFCGKNLIIEHGELAKQANGAVLVKYGNSVVLATACASKEAKDIDFFPLTVTFEEKLYSVGKIPGGFLRREGRPSEHATLTARMIDRPIRPLFPEGFRNEVQVVNTVLSVDNDASVEMAAMFASSLALSISDIPFSGPVAGVNVALVDGEYIINPDSDEVKKSVLDLTLAGTYEAINMVEAGAKEVSEEQMLEALIFGHQYIKKLIEIQKEVVKAVAKEKRELQLFTLDENLVVEVNDFIKDRMIAAVRIVDKLERYQAIDDLTAISIEEFKLRYVTSDNLDKILFQVDKICHNIVKDEVRRLITKDKIRPDGRALTEIRPLDSQIDLLPTVHGSALFTRGQTQVLSVCTLGVLNDYQIIDDLTEIEKKRFIHHYNFPPFSVGEVGRMGSPGRREIGHGALGERALAQVLPSEDDFPYTIRLVAEVLESNGSSSQASICAGTMALMAAGVPIKKPVAGIAMGLVKEGNDYTILTDIQGMEDHLGDMDFKVAGTEDGITALQMDIKIDGLSEEILRQSLAQAKLARMEILNNMTAVIAESRPQVSELAPKIGIMQIAVDKIKDVIGPSGKMINKIIDESDKVKIEIDENGKVVIYHQNYQAIEHAKKMIEEITKEVAVDDVYLAKVVKLEKFGAFVNLFGATDALLHISQIDNKRVEDVAQVLKVGDEVEVKVIAIDDKGKISVSRKVLLEKNK